VVVVEKKGVMCHDCNTFPDLGEAGPRDCQGGILLRSLHGNASVAELARSLTFVPEALGSILRYCIFFFPFN
jgi:hypothetical protein